MLPRVLIAAENASARFGGEAALPLHYFRVLLARGAPVWLVVHERTRAELEKAFPQAMDRVRFIPDTWAHKALWRLGRRLPARLAYLTTEFLMRLITQMLQRRIVRQLVKAQRIDVVHQPTPVSPREPSMLFGFGVPVVIGPMNGGMDYPEAFRARFQSPWVMHLERITRHTAAVLNWLMPGKRQAARLLVANERTRRALPAGVCPQVEQLVENGVDLRLWASDHPRQTLPRHHGALRLVFMGRLVDWKAVDLLLSAFAIARQHVPVSLLIIGDGPERSALEAQARGLGMLGAEPWGDGQVHFAGWQPQQACADWLHASDVLLLTSLLECGGAVVLEAMSMGLPVIASDWGGPADYLDVSCGILVRPDSAQDFPQSIAQAIQSLARDPELRQTLGQRGLDKVRREFDWEVKVDKMIEVYQSVKSARGAHT